MNPLEWVWLPWIICFSAVFFAIVFYFWWQDERLERLKAELEAAEAEGRAEGAEQSRDQWQRFYDGVVAELGLALARNAPKDGAV